MRWGVLCLVLSFAIIGDEVLADQEREDIGVTRTEMMRLYRKPHLDFTFQDESRLRNGTPRVLGECRQCPKDHLTSDWIGPENGYLEQVSITFALSDRISDAYRLKGALALNSLLATVFLKEELKNPTLGDWLERALLLDENTTMYRDGLRIKLVVIKPRDGRLYVLIVDATDGRQG